MDYADQRPHRRLPRRWLRGVAIVMLGSLFVWFAPHMIARSPWWPGLLNHLASDIDARMTADSIQLAWLSPVIVHDIVVDGPDNQRLATIAQLRTQSSLFSLLSHPGRLGTIVIEQPQVAVKLRDSSSNWEDALRPWLARPPSSDTNIETIVVNQGLVVLDRAEGNRPTTLKFASIKVNLPQAQNESGQLLIESATVANGPDSGRCHGQVSWQTGLVGVDWSIQLHAETVPLSLIETVAYRWGNELQLDGQLTGDLEATRQADGDQWTLDLQQLTFLSPDLRAPTWLGQDRLAMQRMQIDGQCTMQAGQWRLTDAFMTCDMGHLEADGQFIWSSQETTNMWQRILAAAPTAEIEIQSEIDLAQLAQLLPETMRLQENTELESGRLFLELQSQARSESHSWHIHAQTNDLTARHDHQRIDWQPVEFTLDAQQGVNGWEIEKLKLQMQFLQLAGHGTAAAGALDLQCDLGQLTREVTQLVRIDGWQAAGKLNSRIQWERTEDQRLLATGSSSASDFQLQIGSRSWQEANLSAELRATGTFQGERLTKLETAELHLKAARDQLDVQLVEPVFQPGFDASYTFTCQLEGELADWAHRLRPLWKGDVDLAGHMLVDATAELSSRGIKIETGKLDSTPFRLSSPALTVNEPQIELAFAGDADFSKRHWRIDDLSLRTAALAVRATNFSGRWPASEMPTPGDPTEQNPADPHRLSPADQTAALTNATQTPAATSSAAWSELRGMVAFRTDLERLGRAWRVPGMATNWRATGQADGQVSVARQADKTSLRWSVGLQDVQLAQWSLPSRPQHTTPANASSKRWQPVWQEQNLKTEGAASYHATNHLLTLDRIELLSGDQLKLSAQGTVLEPLAQCLLDIHGQLAYDLAKLLPKMSPYIGNVVQATGQDTQSFQLTGPLGQPASAAHTDHSPSDQRGSQPTAPQVEPGDFWKQLAGHTGLSWDAARLAGVALGPGQFQAQLKAGVVNTGPIEFSVSQGQLRIVPQLFIDRTPKILQIAPGQVLHEVHLSAQICRTWFQYITPIAADAARAEGHFSLALDRCLVPLDNLSRADVQGTLDIHAAGIGPGPLAQDVLQVAAQIKAILEQRLPSAMNPVPANWVNIPNQRVHVQLNEGQIRHHRFEMQVGEATLLTEGSIGLDQSLALVIRMPIPDAWIQRDQNLAWLTGQTIEIPLRGTLKNPRVDQQALANLSSDMLKNAAGRAIESELQRGLNRLFGPHP